MVNLLLERGAEMNSKALEDALKEGYEYVVCLINVNEEIEFCFCCLFCFGRPLNFVTACFCEGYYINISCLGALYLCSLILSCGSYYEHSRSVVQALVSHPQWPIAMRHTFDFEGKETTPFRHMIRTIPGEVTDVLCKMLSLIFFFLQNRGG